MKYRKNDEVAIRIDGKVFSGIVFKDEGKLVRVKRRAMSYTMRVEHVFKVDICGLKKNCNQCGAPLVQGRPGLDFVFWQCSGCVEKYSFDALKGMEKK